MKNKNLLIIKYFIEKKKSTKLNGIIPTTSKFNTQTVRECPYTDGISQGGKQKQNKSRAQNLYSKPSHYMSQIGSDSKSISIDFIHTLV